MSLRIQMLLWTVGLVLVAFIGCFDSKMRVGRETLIEQKLAQREQIEQLAGRLIAENEAYIGALFSRIDNDRFLAANFAPTESNIESGTWLNSSLLLQDNKWIDLLQNTNQGTLSSAIVLNHKGLSPVEMVPIDRDSSWIYSEGRSEPLIGVRIAIHQSADPSNVKREFEEIPGLSSDLYILFEPKNLLALQLNPEEEEEISLSQFEIPFPAFAQRLVAVQGYLKGGGQPPVKKFDISSERKEETPLAWQIHSIKQRDDEIGLIAILTTLFNTGQFGKRSPAEGMIAGISYFQTEEMVGWSFESQEIFFSKPLFDDALAPGVFKITVAEGMDRIFLTNTDQLHLQAGAETGYLTIGIDLMEILSPITEPFIFVSGGKILAGENIGVDEILGKEVGLVRVDEKSYFFMHIHPPGELDFHLFLLSPEEKEFALLKDFETTYQKLIDKMKLIAMGGVILSLFLLSALYKIRAQRKELRETGRDFVANASHELRTPITIVKGFAETLQDMPELPREMVDEITNKIVRNCERMDGLVKNLLTLADIENLPKNRFHTCDLASLLERCREAALMIYPDAQIDIEKKTEGVMTLADSDILELALMNLIDNACKYSTPPATIQISIDKQRSKALISVSDHGIGIPPLDLDHVFERFYTVDKARSRRLGGAGLGLSIVKTIIDKHEGKIKVASQLGKGTTFTLHLPSASSE